MNKTAIILGSTGLVGSSLLNQILDDSRFEKIKLLLRAPISIEHHKIEQIIINFDEPDSYKSKVIGDVLFCAFGTTLKKAGSKEIQYKIDYTYQYQVIQIAKENGVNQVILVSSYGADIHSSVFYSKMKGELDRDVLALNFNKTIIIRPSVLDGVRKERRIGEFIGILIGRYILPYIPFVSKFRAIKVEIVAKAMLNAVDCQTHIYELEEVFKLSNS
jgi:uncharacterized protein YbjT (DUF2867 family)